MRAPSQSQQPSGREGALSGTAQRGPLRAAGPSGAVAGDGEVLAWPLPSVQGQAARPLPERELLPGWPAVLPRKDYVPARVQPSRRAALVELATSLSGLGLAAFMVLHMALLSSVLLGVASMNALARFLEANYLLQTGAVLLVLLGLAHIVLTARKAPVTFRQQRALLRQMRWLRHSDTWTWAFQVASGAALLVFGAVHLWVILPDLPIQAAKSGARVFGPYLWFYIPFILLVEGHASLGLYRVAVKWGLLSRRWTHTGLTAWTALVLTVGFLVLATFYLIGRSL